MNTETWKRLEEEIEGVIKSCKKDKNGLAVVWKDEEKEAQDLASVFRSHPGYVTDKDYLDDWMSGRHKVDIRGTDKNGRWWRVWIFHYPDERKG